MQLPRIIQGGMGVGVSNWRLANAVSRLGQLGVVSGTALEIMLTRRLQKGDPGGHMTRAIEHFPFPEVARHALDRYFIPGGKKDSEPYRPLPMHSANSPASLVSLTVLASFVEVFLAREGHDRPVGINFLEKIQMPTLPSVYGAMLAGVAYVLMGAGIPRAIPGILDDLSQAKSVKLRLDVAGARAEDDFATRFDPNEWCGGTAPCLDRPAFLGIVSSATLALTLARKSSGRVDGFVVEGSTAGGHNAPPRGAMQLTSDGEPLYGERDVADLEKIREIGLPFWLAGSFGRPGGLAAAQALGATGIQVGTAFAFCDESGIDPEIKRRVIQASRRGELKVFTDPLASPTGFPFKVVQLPGTASDPAFYHARERLCDLGYLRQAYRRDDGSLGYRCPSEPVDHFLRKGGTEQETVGRVCVCNGLSATVEIGQVLPNQQWEIPLVTAGNEVADVASFAPNDRDSYSASDVLDTLLS